MPDSGSAFRVVTCVEGVVDHVIENCTRDQLKDAPEFDDSLTGDEVIARGSARTARVAAGYRKWDDTL
jgi:hypothetical protein